jgi:hypothetical protein
MAVELVGVAAFPHVMIVAVIAYILTGHRGIYPAQRLYLRKQGGFLRHPIPLRDYRDSLAPAPEDARPHDDGNEARAEAKHGE